MSPAIIPPFARRRLRLVIARLREALGEQRAYVFRHFPDEAAHLGATGISRIAEAAGRQGRFCGSRR